MAYSFVELVDTAGDGSGSAASKTSASFTANAGDTIVVWYSYANASTRTATCADSSAANTWTEAAAAAIYDGTATCGIRCFYVLSAAAGTYSVTVTPSANCTWQQIVILRYTGLSAYQTGVTAIQNFGGSNPGTDGCSSGNVTPSSQPALLVGASYNWSAATASGPTAGTGFTNRGTSADQGGANDLACFEDRRLTSTSAVAVTATPNDIYEHFTTALVFTESPAVGSLTGSLTISGQVPTVSKYAPGEFPVSTGVGSLAITGQAPRARLYQKTAPVIEPGDASVSGSNTAGTDWSVSAGVMATGDLGIVYIAWDDSTNVSSVAPPTGAFSEAFTAYSTAPVTDGSTTVRSKLWWVRATGDWTAGVQRVFTANASESWTATWIRVPAGEYDPVTPVGANVGAGNASASAMVTPALTTGATDGQGTLLWFVGINTDPASATVATSGWTTLQAQDLGAVAHAVARRNAPVGNSEAISTATWNMAGTNQDAYTSTLVVVRAPPVPEEIYPESGSLIIAGQAPTVDVPATGSYSVNTFSGALTIAGQAPAIKQDYTSATVSGAITLTGVVSGVAVSGVVNYPVNTLAGSLTITGYEPEQTLETAAPGSGALVITGQVPSVGLGAVPYSIPTFSGQVVITGVVPVVFAAVQVSTGVGSIALTGVAPAVRRDYSVDTGVGSIALSGLAPSLTRDYTASTQAGSLSLSGQVPTVSTGDNPSVATQTGQVVLTGAAPTVKRDFSVSTGAGSVVLAGAVPEIRRDFSVATGVGSVVLAGVVPGVAVGAVPFSIPTFSGQIVLTGAAPSVKRDHSVETQAGSLAISGQAPSVQRDYTVETQSGSLVIGGDVPVLSQAGSWDITTPSGQILLNGEVPRVVNSGDPLPSEKIKGGGRARRKRYERRYVVEIDGNEFVVESAEEAEELLTQAKQVAEELLTDAKSAAKRKKAVKTPKAPKIRVRGPVGDDLTELVSIVSEARESIRDVYETMRDLELAYWLRRAQDDDEEDALTALLIN